MAKETISQTEGLCKEVANCIRNAYDRGYKQGLKDGKEALILGSHEYFRGFEEGKSQGRNEAWECARKIVGDMVEPHFESGYMVDIFGCESAVTAMTNNSASEAIAKIKKYEEKQKAVTIQQAKDCEHCSRVYGTLGCCTTVSNKWVYSCEEGHKEYAERHKADEEIKVGDEVISADGKKGVVWLIYGNECHTMGDYNRARPKEYLKKTGRHFDQIAEVLEQMKGE